MFKRLSSWKKLFFFFYRLHLEEFVYLSSHKDGVKKKKEVCNKRVMAHPIDKAFVCFKAMSCY